MSIAISLDSACEFLHEQYEAAAARTRWDTQERSQKPWRDVPEENKETMRQAVRALLNELGLQVVA